MRSFYDKYYEGYEEDTVLKKNGKEKLIHKYVGIYYRQGVTKPIHFLICLFYVALCLESMILFYNASIQTLGYNTTFYAIICQSLTFLSFIWVLWVLIHYVIAGRDMKIYTYKSTSRMLIRSSMVTASALILDALSVLFYILLNIPDEPKILLIYLEKYVLGSCCIFVINRLENKIPYKRIPDLGNGKE